MRKKILAIVLALVLVAALVPATALATTITSSDTDLQKVFGETHENVTWKTEDGVTTITLSGNVDVKKSEDSFNGNAVLKGKFVIDLAGNTLTMSDGILCVGGTSIDGELTVKDSKTGGKIIGKTGAAVKVQKGNFTLENGCIESTDKDVVPLVVGVDNIDEAVTATIKGGEIVCTTNDYATGVAVWNQGQLIINGGKITVSSTGAQKTRR